jgi:hypothetical protein
VAYDNRSSSSSFARRVVEDTMHLSWEFRKREMRFFTHDLTERSASSMMHLI